MDKIFCHDCGRELGLDEEVMPYEAAGERFFKCKACHQKDPILRNYQKAEVYSRVVGYIRPVSQWNQGKQSEYADRKEFVMSDSACC